MSVLFEEKSLLEPYSDQAFLDARRRANPYEKISRQQFQNRAALKMANLDSLFNLTALPPNGQPLLFADICAGPGGFTEYIMWRRKRTARGWGFTLRGDLDFRLDKFNSESPTDQFLPCYGVDDTGDIYKTANIRHFAELVHRSTAQWAGSDPPLFFIGNTNELKKKNND